MDDELRAKYINLRYNLYIIKNKLSGLKSKGNSLKGLMKGSLLIDGKVVDEDYFDSLISNNTQIINELANTVIPIINSKL
jgi:hypothetical protein